MYHLLAVLLFLAAGGLADQPQKLANIGYISNGYNIIRGNPHEDQLDPGFSQKIFQLNYYLGTLSGDGKWLLPDHVEADQAISCSFNAESHEVTGTTSYREALSVDASVDAAVKGETYGVEFSASAGYSKIQQNTQSSHKLYTSSAARCTRYVARITRHSAINFTESFVSSVMDLPLKPDNESYLEFISTFGTHYLSQLTMGAKFVLTTEFEETAWMSLEQESISLSAAATVDVLAFSGSLSVMSDSQKETAKQFSDKKSSRKESYLGSKPTLDGKWETWAEDAGSSPYPISYVLRPLTELFKQMYFCDMNSTELTMKRDILDAMYTAYCGSLANCGNASADRVPLKMDAFRDLLVGGNKLILTCRPGFWMLSCGVRGFFADKSNSTNEDLYARQRNIGDSSQFNGCHCHGSVFEDIGSIYCYALCVNRFPAIIAVVDQKEASFSITCPDKYKVTACVADSVNLYTYSYPTDNGCSCENNLPLTHDFPVCYAICQPNVINYEVQTATGTGWVTVKCSDTNVVLGCAAKPGNIDDLGDHRLLKSYYVDEDSFDTCTCYGGHPFITTYVTCYAMCGQFA